MSEKFVYLFAEGNETMRELLGGKGANLAEMSRLGMPGHMVSPLRPRHAISIMRMENASMRTSVHRSKSIWPNWRNRQKRSLAM